MSAWGQNSEERLSAQFLLETPPPLLSQNNFPPLNSLNWVADKEHV